MDFFFFQAEKFYFSILKVILEDAELSPMDVLFKYHKAKSSY